MNVVAAPAGCTGSIVNTDLTVLLYANTPDATLGSAGAAVAHALRKLKLHPSPRAWDFLSIALAVIATDLSSPRIDSPDGWTREFTLTISVIDPAFWSTQSGRLEQLLAFLTTDRWRIRFIDQGYLPQINKRPTYPTEDCVVLLSGGLDSFTGVLDLAQKGAKPLAVSHTVRGEAETQRALAALATGNGTHLQLNHNASVPNKEVSPSQRARSLIFIAYAVMAATTLARYHSGETIPLYVCENGFIGINPPLTPSRLGSLSTRTTHPVVFALLQELFLAAQLRIHISNPYRFLTKGEMLIACSRQTDLLARAHDTTSCGRFHHYKNTHCGRCVPCLVRRSSFLKWNVPDATDYVFDNLSISDADHMQFDDVRSVAMAIAAVKTDGLDRWLGASLSSPLISDKPQLKSVVQRGLMEIEAVLNQFAVK